MKLHQRRWQCPVCKQDLTAELNWVAPGCSTKVEIELLDQIFDTEVAKHQLTHGGK